MHNVIDDRENIDRERVYYLLSLDISVALKRILHFDRWRRDARLGRMEESNERVAS